MSLTGQCLCGAVTIRVAGGHDPRPGACHCRMCQRWSGGLFLCFNADADGVKVEGPVTRYASSDFAERAFCADLRQPPVDAERSRAKATI